MNRHYTEEFKDNQLDELVKGGVLVSYSYKAIEDFQVLKLTLTDKSNGELRTIHIVSNAGCESNSSLSVDVF